MSLENQILIREYVLVPETASTRSREHQNQVWLGSLDHSSMIANAYRFRAASSSKAKKRSNSLNNLVGIFDDKQILHSATSTEKFEYMGSAFVNRWSHLGEHNYANWFQDLYLVLHGTVKSNEDEMLLFICLVHCRCNKPCEQGLLWCGSQSVYRVMLLQNVINFLDQDLVYQNQLQKPINSFHQVISGDNTKAW